MSFVVDGLKMRASVRKVPPAVVPPMLSHTSFAEAAVAMERRAVMARRRRRMMRSSVREKRFYMENLAKVSGVTSVTVSLRGQLVAPSARRLDRQRLAGVFTGRRRRAGGGPAGEPPALRTSDCIMRVR